MIVVLIILAAVVVFLIGVTIFQYIKPPRNGVGRRQSTPTENEAILEQRARANATSTWIGPS